MKIVCRYWCVGWVVLWLSSCQPSVLCDPGQRAMAGGCYPDPASGRDAGGGPGLDGGEDDGGSVSGEDAGCGGSDPYEGFKRSCTTSADCSCRAPHCEDVMFGYCTKLNCDPTDARACPPGWTCLMIPPGSSPDPSITHLCLDL